MITSNRLTNPLYISPPNYDTGWVVCNDWTDQALGTIVGGNVVHNLDLPMVDLTTRVLVSSDGTDNNAIELYSSNDDTGSGDTGISIYFVNSDNIYVQTGADGIARLSGAGVFTPIPNGWYYRIIVTSRRHVVSVRDVSGDISTTAIYTGRNDSDGKRIYRREWTGTTGTGGTSTVALGITIDRVTAPMVVKVDSSSFGWIGPEGSGNLGVYFTNTTQDNITLYHNAVHLQSRAYRLILEYTI